MDLFPFFYFRIAEDWGLSFFEVASSSRVRLLRSSFPESHIALAPQTFILSLSVYLL